MIERFRSWEREILLSNVHFTVVGLWGAVSRRSNRDRNSIVLPRAAPLFSLEAYGYLSTDSDSRDAELLAAAWACPKR